MNTRVKWSKDLFLSELESINPDIELLSEYNGMNTKSEFRCKLDGYEWKAPPKKLIYNKTGCRVCGYKKNAKEFLWSHEKYVEQLKLKNPNLEVIEPYIKSNVKIKHRCIKHDYIWSILPSSALGGSMCPICTKEFFHHRLAKTQTQYVNEVESITPDIEVIGEYINDRTPITHKCKIHNYIWDAVPDNILKGHKCPLCGIEATSQKRTLSFEEYLSRLEEINSPLIPIESYINCDTPIKHKCKNCGLIFSTRPYGVYANYTRCLGCSSNSKGEEIILAFLNKHNIKYEHHKKFEELIGLGNRQLSYDFYLPDYNKLIEFQGEQHYRPVEIFGGQEAFEKQQEHDKRKLEYAINNNIELLEISYLEFDNIENILLTELNIAERR